MLNPTTNDAVTLALAALAATLNDERRAMRFLDITGLSVDELRVRAAGGDRILLAASLAFLEDHEPDLLAVSDAIGASPAALVAARHELER